MTVVRSARDINIPSWNECGPQLVDALYQLKTWLVSPDISVETIDQVRAMLSAAIDRYERSSAPGGSSNFLRARFGKNWVLARRSPRIVAKYGPGVICVSKKQYRQAEADYLDGKAP